MADVPVHVCETGLRDGLQLVRAVVPTPDKVRLLDALAACGFPEIDAASFVPAQVVPQFVDAADVVAAACRHPGWRVGALAPNLRGAERALAAGAQLVSFVVSVSRGHNLANVRRTPEEQVAVARTVAERLAAAQERPSFVAGLATAFGCSIEGRVPTADVCRLAVAMRAAGADEITLADTVGYADPALVRRTVAAVRDAVGAEVPLRLHLHDTMGTGLANALAGLEAGITRFDAAVGGLGGCPFAPGASGNVATEDLVFMLERMGIRTGIDLEKLVAASRLLDEVLPGERLRSHVREAGIPRIYASAARPDAGG